MTRILAFAALLALAACNEPGGTAEQPPAATPPVTPVEPAPAPAPAD